MHHALERVRKRQLDSTTLKSGTRRASRLSTWPTVASSTAALSHSARRSLAAQTFRSLWRSDRATNAVIRALLVGVSERIF